MPRRAISQLNSPIDMTLLRRFAQTTRLEPTDPLYAFMKMVGDDLLEYLRVARERLDFIDQRVERWTIPCGDDVIEALFLPRTERRRGRAELHARQLHPRPEARQRDRRDRVSGSPRRAASASAATRIIPALDFSRVEAQPDVHFAHKSGFMCKTSASDPARLKELITLAWQRR